MANSSLTMKSKSVHPFDRISEWSVVKSQGVALFINAGNTQFSLTATLDIEHDGKGNFVGLGIYEPTTNACYYWSDFNLAKEVTIPLFIAHNGTSDLKYLKQWGFNVNESYLLHDTMLMAHILDSSRKNYGLKNLVKQEFGVEYPDYSSIVGKKGTLSLLDFPVEAVAEYNACDTYWTHKLFERLWQVTNQDSHRYFETIEKPCAGIFQTMSDRGIKIDMAYLRELKGHLEEQIRPLESDILNQLGNINLDSPKQLLGALNAKEIFPEFKNKASTDKRALKRLSGNPIVDKLLRYSELSTLLSSFVYSYLERGECEIDDAHETISSFAVHPFFNQVGTRTGRLSCSNPNLLQIPKRTDNGKLVRKMFVSCNGYLLGDCDFGQIEPRIMAHLSKDTNMREMFTQGVDFHNFTAEKLQIDREKAKILNLSVGYRASYKSVSQQLGCSEQEAQKEIDEWWEMFPQLRMWQDRLIWQSKKDGYFTTLMGRRIKVDNLTEYNKWKREAAQRQLINNITQASAAEVMKLGMIKVAALEDVHILIQVYDELVFEAKRADMDVILEKVKYYLENSVALDVPLVVDAKSGLNWAEVA